MLDHLSETAKHAIDALSLGALLAALFDYLPGITAVLTAIWIGMRMVESYQAIKLNNRKLRGRE